MNTIHKTYPAPEILTDKGQTLTRASIDQAESGEDKLSFNYSIYGHSSVKQQLISDQHNKCAYCEQSLNGDFGNVEHYRPKAGYCTTGTPLKTPGYYWLAYNWDNLLLSCSTCNIRHKKNLFPLLDETTRDIQHRDITKETPLLLNPVVENPGDHICFERHIIKPQITDGIEDPVGKTTIETFKLNDREDLVERRRQRWEEYKGILDNICLLETISSDDRFSDLDIQPHLQTEKDLLATIKSEQSEFTGMFKYQVSRPKR